MPEETLYPLLYDVKLKRPGCVLLQAVAGGDRALLDSLFSSEDWLITPTDDMMLMRGTLDQWKTEVG